MGPYSEEATAKMRDLVHQLSNDLTVAHANLYVLLKRHAAGLTPEAAYHLSEANDACDRAMALAIAMHRMV